LTSIELSRKVQILCQILDAAKECGDKTLVFSHSIATLDFLDKLCQRHGRKFARLDGKTPMKSRQGRIKAFNEGHLDTYLISTKAGGLGLNLFGANRVVIFDFGFNPILEEQAVGRAYRIGQKKKVFVYRFVAGGTFEDSVHNKSVFKKQLASRVVDKKNPIARATRNVGEFLFEPREVPQKDLSEFEGLDPVLDKILALQSQDNNTIRAIVQTDTFETDDEVVAFTKDEKAEVAQMLIDSKLKRTDPRGWDTLMASRQQEMITAARLKNIYPVIAGQLSATGAIIPATQPAYTSVQQNFREGLQVRPRSSLPLGSEASRKFRFLCLLSEIFLTKNGPIAASSPSNKAPSTSSSAVTDPKPNSSGTTAADMNQVCLPSIPYSQNLIPASTIGSQSHQSVADSIRARMQSLTHYHPKD
jgi:superfamily II DNA/RNA helicase